MIFYFTGTGNSLAAAQTIARATDDLLVDIGAAYKYKDFDFTLAQGEQLGFVFPVYNYTTPPIIDAFLKRARFRTGNKETFTPDYCFAVISCGAFVGSTARVFGKRLLDAQGINLDASFSVKSVGNCTYLYAPAQGEKRKRLLAGAELAARETANRIAAREHVRAEHRNPPRHRAVQVHRKGREAAIHLGVLRAAHLHQLRPVRRPLPHQHHHDHRRRAPLGRAGLHAVPRLPAPLPRERHPVRCEDRASRPLRQPRPRESSQARITLLPSLVQAIP